METKKFYIGAIKEEKPAQIVCQILGSRHSDFVFSVDRVDDYHQVFCEPRSGHCNPDILRFITNERVFISEIVHHTLWLLDQTSNVVSTRPRFTQEKWCDCEAQAPENWIEITGTHNGSWFNQCECGLHHKGHAHCNICGGLTETY